MFELEPLRVVELGVPVVSVLISGTLPGARLPLVPFGVPEPLGVVVVFFRSPYGWEWSADEG